MIWLNRSKYWSIKGYEYKIYIVIIKNRNSGQWMHEIANKIHVLYMHYKLFFSQHIVHHSKPSKKFKTASELHVLQNVMSMAVFKQYFEIIHVSPKKNSQRIFKQTQ